MENRFQYFLLRVLRHIKSGRISLLLLGVLTTLLPIAASAQNNTQANLSTIDNELFDIGMQVGLINIEDFGSEIVLGTSATFKASEDFFLQFNFCVQMPTIHPMSVAKALTLMAPTAILNIMICCWVTTCFKRSF
jgi:hypothetical protein